MSKLLTTGEMIDKLKVGEVARVAGVGACITRVHEDLFKFCTKDGDCDGFSEVTLNSHILEYKWRILPNYVSFDEAMKALKQGKMVKLHRNNGLDVTVFRKWFSLESREDVTFDDLFNGKWTIEED